MIDDPGDSIVELWDSNFASGTHHHRHHSLWKRRTEWWYPTQWSYIHNGSQLRVSWKCLNLLHWMQIDVRSAGVSLSSHLGTHRFDASQVLRCQTATVVTAAVASPAVSTTAIATTAAAIASVPCKRSMWKCNHLRKCHRIYEQNPNHPVTLAKSQKQLWTSGKSQESCQIVWKKKGIRRIHVLDLAPAAWPFS